MNTVDSITSPHAWRKNVMYQLLCFNFCWPILKICRLKQNCRILSWILYHERKVDFLIDVHSIIWIERQNQQGLVRPYLVQRAYSFGSMCYRNQSIGFGKTNSSKTLLVIHQTVEKHLCLQFRYTVEKDLIPSLIDPSQKREFLFFFFNSHGSILCEYRSIRVSIFFLAKKFNSYV